METQTPSPLVEVSSDYVIELINETGQTSLLTNNIKEKLDAIIIDSNEKTEVIIESELGYLILHRREQYGINYYCPRARTTTPIENLLDYLEFEKFNLNEKLIITIRGRKNEKVKLIFRFS
jgi:hypothetical protein